MPSIDLFLHFGPRQSDGTYTVVSHWEDLRDVQRSFVLGKATFDFTGLSDEGKGLEEYGRLLSEGAFGDEKIKSDFRSAYQAAGNLQADFRLRIAVDVAIPELHSLRWELLREPDAPQGPLATKTRVLFSRYLPSDGDGWAGRPRARQELTAVAVVAAPQGLDEKRFAPINADQWADLVQQSLGDEIKIRWLGAKGGARATLEAIGKELRDCQSDILILIAHGMLDNEKKTPILWLEGGKVGDGPAGAGPSRTSGLDLVEQIQGLETPPRLVVLCSCQSAGGGGARGSADWEVLAALGPQVAQVGVPAVVAMQGLVPMKMAGDFLDTFFHEIRVDGQVDRAVAAARARVQGQPEHWMPTLFLRLKSGNIRWYTRGFMVSDGFKRWSALIEDIAENRCTPLLGPGLYEPLIGSNRDLARRWSSDPTLTYPMAGLYGADLQQVAQFLAVSGGLNFPRDKLKRHLVEEFIKRFGAKTEPFRTRYLNLPQQRITEELLSGVMTAAWQSETGPNFAKSLDAHAILARLPFPVYLTANPDGLLSAALSRANTLDGQLKRPRRVDFAWAKVGTGRPVVEGGAPGDQGYQPSEKEPLVGHLLGSFRNWDSVPVTEDDYFEYLLRFTENRPKLHDEVQRALGSTSLLLLGFQLDDWSFRVLLHALRTFDNDPTGKKGNRVAVQINPAEERVRDQVGAHKFVDESFQSKNIFVYWGSAEDFLGELWEQWDALAGAGVGG